jgi:hypothetical protein
MSSLNSLLFRTIHFTSQTTKEPNKLICKICKQVFNAKESKHYNSIHNKNKTKCCDPCFERHMKVAEEIFKSIFPKESNTKSH